MVPVFISAASANKGTDSAYGYFKHFKTAEWLTIILLLLVMAVWLVVTAFHASLPLPVVLVAGAVVVTLHMSLQHEVIHGHPTRSKALNRLLAGPSFCLWLPFERYRKTHLQHHRDEHLTDPLEDPESVYVSPEDWVHMPLWRRSLALILNTLSAALFLDHRLSWRSSFGAMQRRSPAVIRTWHRPGRHIAAAAPVVIWLTVVAEMSLLVYGLFFVWPRLLCSSARSPTRAASGGGQNGDQDAVRSSDCSTSTTIFTPSTAMPGLAWYRLPSVWRADPDGWARQTGGFVFQGYGDVAARYLLSPKDHPVHPGSLPLSTTADAVGRQTLAPPRLLPLKRGSSGPVEGALAATGMAVPDTPSVSGMAMAAKITDTRPDWSAYGRNTPSEGRSAREPVDDRAQSPCTRVSGNPSDPRVCYQPSGRSR